MMGENNNQLVPITFRLSKLIFNTLVYAEWISQLVYFYAALLTEFKFIYFFEEIRGFFMKINVVFYA